MCFMVSKYDMFLIYMGLKYITLRKTTDSHRVGGIYQIKLNLFDKYAFKVKILNKEYLNLNNCSPEDLQGVGYTKEDYLKQPYNIKNSSKDRIKYTFKIVETDYNRLSEIIGGFL